MDGGSPSSYVLAILQSYGTVGGASPYDLATEHSAGISAESQPDAASEFVLFALQGFITTTVTGPDG